MKERKKQHHRYLPCNAFVSIYASLWSLYAPLRRFTRVHRRVKTEMKCFFFSSVYIPFVHSLIHSMLLSSRVVNPSARFLSTNSTTTKIISYFGYFIQSNVIAISPTRWKLEEFSELENFYTTQISYTSKCESAEWMNIWTIEQYQQKRITTHSFHINTNLRS